MAKENSQSTKENKYEKLKITIRENSGNAMKQKKRLKMWKWKYEETINEIFFSVKMKRNEENLFGLNLIMSQY